MSRFTAHTARATSAGLKALTLTGLSLFMGCGDANGPTAQPDIQPPTSTATGAPATSATGVPVLGGESTLPGDPAGTAAAAVLPPPPLAVDGYESVNGWHIADFGNPGSGKIVKPSYASAAPKDQLVLELTYTPGDKSKICVRHDWRINLQPAGKITAVVYNHAPADIAVAVAFTTGDAFEWFESVPQIAKPGWNTLVWNAAEKTWKSAAAQWQNTAALNQPGDVRALHFLVFNEHRNGVVTLAGLMADTVGRTPPVTPAPVAAVDWDTLVAQLPVSPQGHVKGLQAGTWVNEISGDPARVVVAPSALSTATERMLVLDWAAASAGAPRKKQFVAAKQAFYPPLTLNNTGVLALDVYNAAETEATVSVGIIAGEQAIYHETKPVKLAPAAWTTLKFPLDGKEYKSAATNWEPTGALAHAETLTAVMIKAFTTDAAGRLFVTALNAPIVTPPPSPQPLPPVENTPAPAPAPAPEVVPQPAPADPAVAPVPAPEPATTAPTPEPPVVPPAP